MFAVQVGYWSLFVDGLFEKGMSHKGATYSNQTSLSADTKFEVCAYSNPAFAGVHSISRCYTLDIQDMLF